jgi:hypothetical protein
MEIAARNSLAHRLVQRIAMYPIFFALFFGAYVLIEHLWPPSRPLWRTALWAAMMSAVFAALYPARYLRKPKLGDTSRS